MSGGAVPVSRWEQRPREAQWEQEEQPHLPRQSPPRQQVPVCPVRPQSPPQPQSWSHPPGPHQEKEKSQRRQTSHPRGMRPLYAGLVMECPRPSPGVHCLHSCSPQGGLGRHAADSSGAWVVRTGQTGCSAGAPSVAVAVGCTSPAATDAFGAGRSNPAAGHSSRNGCGPRGSRAGPHRHRHRHHLLLGPLGHPCQSRHRDPVQKRLHDQILLP